MLMLRGVLPGSAMKTINDGSISDSKSTVTRF